LFVPQALEEEFGRQRSEQDRFYGSVSSEKDNPVDTLIKQSKSSSRNSSVM
jgi:hypothetical protein